jgi:hypothetical protein
MIILIAFKKQQAPSYKLQTAGDGKGWASGNRKPETGNLFSMITLIAFKKQQAASCKPETTKRANENREPGT